MARGETIAGLDIGTTKTCAVVAASGPDGLEIIGIGEAPSTGMRKGVVTDLEATVHAIEAATEKAERMAGVHVSSVYVGVTGEHISSTNNRGVVAVTGEDREVVATDVRRVVDASKIINLAAERQIIHALPRHFTIDGQDGVHDPVGMSGGRLEVDTHIVTGGSSFISNVLKCVHRAGLEPAGIVFEPLASGAATLLPEERQVGVVLLDIGGGTTDIAVFADGGIVHSATIPVGGNIITNDIALGLKTTFAEAENVKRTYGSGLVRPDDAETSFQVKTLDGRSTREVTSSQLRAIVLPRVLELFRMAKTNIVEHIARDQVLSEIVLTGGGAQLRGIDTTAGEVFGLPVRIGVPTTVAGLTDAVKQPQYATAVGLVLFGPRGEAVPHLNGQSSGVLAKLWTWWSSLWN
ncbi:MAG TPA: cell division protein FtsA [Candidatus Baltobacteraceae bacterium]|nr:cell division protein FtsA [Candidatus Baltobacteraceae bacterium]